MQQNLIELQVPVPPLDLVRRILEYNGQARYVGAWWEPCGDEMVVGDGRVTATAGNWGAFLALLRLSPWQRALAGYVIGSADSECRHILVFDLQSGQAFVADAMPGRKFLQDQWPHAPLLGHGVLVIPDLDFFEILGEREQEDPGQLMRRVDAALKECARTLDDLKAWWGEM